MAKIKLTKGELKRQRDSLQQFRHYLPILQLKKKQLQIKIEEIRRILVEKQKELHLLEDKISQWQGLLADPFVDIKPWLEVEGFSTFTTNIAGAEVPVFKEVSFKQIAIDYYSNELPGYPYPYSHITSFCNGSRGGGMETPMMTNDGESKSVASIVGLLSHEIAHSYFPFIMGTNERKYAWMDEGWASFFPEEIVNGYVPSHDYWIGRCEAYSRNAGKESELPPIVPSYTYKGKYVRTGFYNRPTNAYKELEILLGRKLFKKALLEYMKRWNGKHPISYDFFFTFNDVVNEDLTWFWKPWFFEFGYPDLTVEKVNQNNDRILIKIVKLGNIPTRVEVTIEFENGIKEIIKKSARIWQDGKDSFEIEIPDKTEKVKSVTVGNKHIPDAVIENNSYILIKE